jgi:hypothetical protein
MHRITPDRAALEVAHRALRNRMPLDEMLKDPTLAIIVRVLARRHMQRRERVDVKKLQANDKD